LGPPERPEKVDAAIAQSERASTVQAGIKLLPKEKIETALAKSGEPLETPCFAPKWRNSFLNIA
jgi:hypothetical protein